VDLASRPSMKMFGSTPARVNVHTSWYVRC